MTAVVAPLSRPQSRPAPVRLMPWHSARKKRIPDFVAKLVFGQPLPPTEAEWQQVQEALWQGDPAMDQLVDWLFATGPRVAKPMFDQALERGIDSLDNPPQPLRDFFALVDRDPPWLNRALLDTGAAVSHLGGKVGFYVLRDMALMGGYAYFNSMNQTLASSGSLRKDTSQRLGETGKWLNDVTEIGGMNRFSDGFKTTIRVRLVHALVRRNLLNKPDWEADKWGLPINQIDMQATYLAFGPAALLGSRAFGVPVRKKQAHAFLHLWRYVGWLMGVDEQWLAITEGDGLRKLYHTFLTHRLPDDKIRQLGQALRDEPRSRYLPELEGRPRMAALKRWFLYQQHLSNSSLILGPRERRQLGLPMTILPWYPAISAPWRFLALNYYVWRGGHALERYAARMRQVQRDLLIGYFGRKQPDIIQPGTGHPAHL
jgi:hypothetical protein